MTYMYQLVILLPFLVRDLVAQLFLRNCNLCVLSRYGITDGNIELISLAAEWEYIDALHLAGNTRIWT